VGGETGDLVSQSLRGDDGNFARQFLVGLEIDGHTRVVFLDDEARSLLDCLGSDATLHVKVIIYSSRPISSKNVL
jgi:hypothetical protein